MIGALTLSVLDNILGLRNIESEYQAILKGVIIVLAVVLQRQALPRIHLNQGIRRTPLMRTIPRARLLTIALAPVLALGVAGTVQGTTEPAGARVRHLPPRRRHRGQGQLPGRHVAGEPGRALASGDERSDRRRRRGPSGVGGRLRRRRPGQRPAGRRRRELPVPGHRPVDHLAERGGPVDRRRRRRCAEGCR